MQCLASCAASRSPKSRSTSMRDVSMSDRRRACAPRGDRCFAILQKLPNSDCCGLLCIFPEGHDGCCTTSQLVLMSPFEKASTVSKRKIVKGHRQQAPTMSISRIVVVFAQAAHRIGRSEERYSRPHRYDTSCYYQCKQPQKHQTLLTFAKCREAPHKSLDSATQGFLAATRLRSKQCTCASNIETVRQPIRSTR